MDYKEINFSPINFPIANVQLPKESFFARLNKGILFHLTSQSPLFIRWMAIDDLPFVCDLEYHIFPSPWSLESFLYELENRNYNISIVGLLDRTLVTYAVSYRVLDEIHISNLAVAPEFRQLKIGETMLWMTLQIGKEKNSKQAHLEVRRSNTAAISLYQKYGFKVIGVRKNYYEEQKEDALLMSRTIDGDKIHGVV